MLNKKRSTRIRIWLWAMGILTVLGIIAQIIFTHKVKRALAKESSTGIQLHYDKISTNVLAGRISLQNVTASDSGNTFGLVAKNITASGLGYIALLKNNGVTLSELRLEEPFFTYRKKEHKTDSMSKKNGKGPSPKVDIQKLIINKGRLKQFHTDSDSLQLHIEGIDLQLEDILMDGTTSRQKIPFTYGEYTLNTQQLYCDLGPFEFLRLQQLQLNANEGQVHHLELKSKYGKQELSKKLVVEHDHYDLTIDTLRLEQLNFGPKDSTLQLRLAQLQLERPIFHVYRDKLIPDDTTHKKLYNQALRDLDLDLQVDSIGVTDGTITYEERLEIDVDPESVKFTDLDATITNLHSQGSGSVNVETHSQLMGNGRLELDWSFDPQNTSNDFLATGSLSDFDSAEINPFLKTNLTAEVSGSVNQLYFTMSGNELKSSGDMKMNYDQFEFKVLRKDRSGVNKVLTAVVNIFARKNSDTDADGYRHGTFEVERNTDKSFFNYLWINVKAGLVDTVTGNGKKKRNQ